jgi:acyl dehydratase
MSGIVELPAETRAAIGTVTEHVYEVTRKDIRRYAQAIGDPDPRYREGEVAPPLFCHSLAFDDVPVEALRPDGLPTELDVPLPTERAVGGGSSYDVGIPVRAGDTITVRTEIEDIYSKSGRSGDLIFVVLTTTYTNQNGEQVARERGEFINR